MRDGDVAALAGQLRAEAGDRDVWLIGGGGAIAAFRAAGRIDEYYLAVIPVLLGEGVPLFHELPGRPAEPLRLLASRAAAGGVVLLRYAAGAGAGSAGSEPAAQPAASHAAGGEPDPAVGPDADAGPALEIERKYLLRALPPLPAGTTSAEVEQGWLPGEKLAERLRRTERDGRVTYHRAVKSGRGVTRIEIEEETTRELFDYLWPLTEGRRVRKRRHYVSAGALTWEIDEFTDRDLVLAEVELPSKSTPVPVPAWLEPVLVREVTGEDAYVNLRLAR
jgi:adenylate cyclase